MKLKTIKMADRPRCSCGVKMKLVINRCYGGFSLSLLAQKRYCELIGKEAHFYRAVGSNSGVKVGVEEQSLFIRCVHRDYGERVDLDTLPDDAFFDYRKLDRDNPILIRVVEELGEKANGNCAQLKIIEIPDGVEWQIEEYDGLEWVAEKHRTWR